MKFEHKVVVEATADRVQAFLDDIQKAAKCVPGVEEVTPLEDGWYEGRVGIKFGPLGMKFSGKAKLEKEPDGTWKMHGEGRDRRIGAGVNADVIAHLTETTPGTTEVLVNADLNFSGRLAEMGQPLIRKKSDSMVAEFARNLQQALKNEK
jgi:carbon monoxide dehydrogenase subunit G